jgi:hypothetical protein
MGFDGPMTWRQYLAWQWHLSGETQKDNKLYHRGQLLKEKDHPVGFPKPWTRDSIIKSNIAERLGQVQMGAEALRHESEMKERTLARAIAGAKRLKEVGHGGTK